MWDKKGMEAGGTIIIFFSFLVLILFLAVPYSFVKSPEKVQAVVPKDIQYAIQEQRLLHKCFTYKDDTINRFYPKIVVAAQVTMPNINKCFGGGTDVSVTLSYGTQKIGPLNAHKASVSHKYPVTVFTGTNFIPGEMELQYE